MKLFLYFLGIFVVFSLQTQRDVALQPDSSTSSSTTSITVCTDSCNENRDCVYSQWGQWGFCEALAGCEGAMVTTRYRGVALPSLGYGRPCSFQEMNQTRNCNDTEIQALKNSSDYQQTCAVGCVLGPWYEASPCNVTAANCPSSDARPLDGMAYGWKLFLRNVTQPAKNGGANCPSNSKLEDCSIPCAYDCQWGPWSVAPGQCDMPCKNVNGTSSQPKQLYTRAIQFQAINGGKACAGSNVKYDGTCLIVDKLPLCCQGCSEGPWSGWTTCQTSATTSAGKPCGTGSRSRSRVVKSPTNFAQYCPNAAPQCGASQQTEMCCESPCPVDCRCGDWSGWGNCLAVNTTGCGDARRTRSRVCTPPQFGGLPCPETVNIDICILPGCPTPCKMGPWSNWTGCTTTCGPRQTQTRTRVIIQYPTNGGSPCQATVETKECPCIECPIDCKVSEWQAWGPCDQPCGNGTQYQIRDVIQEPRNGGQDCPTRVRNRTCLLDNTDGVLDGLVSRMNDLGRIITEIANLECDVNCRVTQWSAWSGCSKTCTSLVDSSLPGTKRRSRTVLIPAGGRGVKCPSTEQIDFCNSPCCPIDCVLSEWAQYPYTECSAPCGGGKRRVERRILTYPRCGGVSCNTSVLYKDEDCNTQCCDGPCEYHPWENATTCVDASVYYNTGALKPITCGPGVRIFQRAVKKAPCGKVCKDTILVQNCSAGTCFDDCKVGNWSAWTICDKQCGWGYQYRSRVLTQPTPGGTPCPCGYEFQPCKLKDCCPTCNFTEWTSWESCNVTCGGGWQARRRSVLNPGGVCNYDDCVAQGLKDTRQCNSIECEKPCEVSGWDKWGPCSVTCGVGFQTRTRNITHYNTGHCPYLQEQRACGGSTCPPPCEISEWTPWTPCPVSCTNPGDTTSYYQYRNKYRISGEPPCAGTSVNRTCFLPECYVPCKVSDWGQWSPCDPPHGWGYSQRTRSVVPADSTAKDCPSLSETKYCYSPPLPNDCEWSVWSEWGDWSATCGYATKYRNRVLLSSKATFETDQGSVTLNLTACYQVGSLTSTKTEFLGRCPVPCKVTPWGNWTSCVWPGIRYRGRSIISREQYGGFPCPPCVTEYDRCTYRNTDPTRCEVQPCVLATEQ